MADTVTVTSREWEASRVVPELTKEAGALACNSVNAVKSLSAFLGVDELALAEKLADGRLVGLVEALSRIAWVTWRATQEVDHPDLLANDMIVVAREALTDWPWHQSQGDPELLSTIVEQRAADAALKGGER